MPKFQKRDYHPDATEQHVLTTGDVLFLTELQLQKDTKRIY